MPRALLELEHALPGVTKAAYAVVPALGGTNSKGRDDLGRLKLLLREYLKPRSMEPQQSFHKQPRNVTAPLKIGPLGCLKREFECVCGLRGQALVRY